MPEPLAFILGDSISKGYTPTTAEKLAGRVRVDRPQDNCKTSAYTLDHLADWLSGRAPQVVHFNAGLHDLARDTTREAPNRVPLPQYRENLKAIVDWLRGNTDAALLWATTTPVVDEWHAANKSFYRAEAEVEAYNAAALEVMTTEGIAVNDLHRVIVDAGPKACIKPDGVHMLERGNSLLTEAVARSILQALGKTD